ncbi:MAG: sensor histidine kinase, partial [Muribaculaceae bacterium]|nr:sensor histidine kinase [Muribaculaceae bacterium]
GGRRAMLRFVLWNLLLMAGGLLLSELSRDVFGMPGRHGRHALFSVSFLVREAVMEILTIGLAVALRMSSLWQSADNQRQELLAEQRSTELDSLKSQLNPHFLFNTLNTIYALVDINPEDAKNAVHKLSGLLRYLLYEDVATVALSREIEFIKNYIELMRMRMSRHKMVLDIDIAGYESAPVPPLLLLPLVENAVKYGSSGRDSEPIRIAISISDGKLSCSTSNSFIPRSADERGSDRSSGIGLANLKRRLILLYGHAARLSIMTDGDIYTSNLLIPVNNE